MAERNKDGTFKKGSASNPAGRPKGSGVTGKLRKAILDKSPELLSMLVDKALIEQDCTAAMALLNKVLPNLKATNEPVTFPLDVKNGLSSTGEQIVKNIADGTIPLDSGTQVLNSLAALSKIQEVDALTKRIEALEKQNNLIEHPVKQE